MIQSSFYKLSAKNIDERFIHSDNFLTYFSVSDFMHEDDGLYSGGFKIFQSILPENSGIKINNKFNTFNFTHIGFSKKYDIECFLFKNNKGFLIELKDKGIIFTPVKEYSICFKITTPFEIIEKNINNVILSYNKSGKQDTGFKKYFCSFSVSRDYSIDKAIKENDFLLIKFKCGEKPGSKPFIYVLYDSDYDDLKKTIDGNINKIDEIKNIHIESSTQTLKNLNLLIEDKLLNKAIYWSIHSSLSFIMKKDKKLGIWAGYPWFTNFWGRDTFISLAGTCLVLGKFQEAGQILINFSKHQSSDKKSNDYCKIPNFITNTDIVSYNSADSTPLFIRAVYEYFLYTADYELLVKLWDNIELAVENVYLKNKKENINFLHDDSEDWMDAKDESGKSYTPRKNKAVEIYSLWYSALYASSIMAEAIIKFYNINKKPDRVKKLKVLSENYQDEALKLKEYFKKTFLSEKEPYIHDHIKEENKKISDARPNSILSYFFPQMPGIPELIDEKTLKKLFIYLLPKIIYNHGVSSLDKKSSLFHPVHLHENYHKDAAYHNGMIWTWLSGPFTNLCCKLNLHDFAYEHTLTLSRNLLDNGALGTLSELYDPCLDDNLKVSAQGAYSQAWSLAEFNRAFFQDYLGIKLNAPDREIYINPKLPDKISIVKTNILFGDNEKINLYFRINKKWPNISYLEIKVINLIKTVMLKINIYQGSVKNNEQEEIKYITFNVKMTEKDDCIRASFDLTNMDTIKLREIYLINNCSLISSNSYSSFGDKPDLNLEFTEDIIPNELDNFETIRNKNHLANKIFK